MANGGYAVMDNLAPDHGHVGAWPAFDAMEIAGITRWLGWPSSRVTTHDELVNTLDEMMPELAGRREPLLVEVALTDDGDRRAGG